MTSLAATRAQARSGMRPVDSKRDLVGLADLIELAFAEGMDPSGRRMAQEMRRFGRLGWLGWLIGRLVLPPAAYPNGYVWIEGGRLVGNASLMPVESDRERWVMANVAVHPAYRRRGIARRLVGACIDLARRRLVREIVLQVRPETPGAANLYRSFGFVDAGTRVTWRLADSPRLAAAPGLPARRRRPEDGEAQWHLARRVSPLGLLWPHPLRRSIFRTEAWYAADAWTHWVWPERGPIRACLMVRPELGGGRQMILLTEPEAAGSAEAPLLERALTERAGVRNVSLESFAGDGEAAVRAAGFREEHRLIWMSLNLRGGRR